MMCGGLGGRKEGRNEGMKEGRKEGGKEGRRGERKKERKKIRKRRKSTRILPWYIYRFYLSGSTFLWNTVPQDRLIALPGLSVLRQLINSVPDFKNSMMCFQELYTGEWSQLHMKCYSETFYYTTK
jgi:hypothetical protein